jgi:hypothetical protein
VEVARYLRDHTAETDPILVLGPEPQIYFYARRRAVTGHLYTYSLMEQQKYALRMQQEMIREIEAGQPKYIVYVDDHYWLRHNGSEEHIFDWFDSYRQGYELVGFVEVNEKETRYYWGADADRGSRARSACWIEILRRKAAS